VKKPFGGKVQPNADLVPVPKKKKEAKEKKNRHLKKKN